MSLSSESDSSLVSFKVIGSSLESLSENFSGVCLLTMSLFFAFLAAVGVFCARNVPSTFALLVYQCEFLSFLFFSLLSALWLLFFQMDECFQQLLDQKLMEVIYWNHSIHFVVLLKDLAYLWCSMIKTSLEEKIF